MIDEKRIEIVRDVEFYWTKLDKVVKPFGVERWETQIRTRDEAKAKELQELFLTVKKEVAKNEKGFKDGEIYWKTNLKRNLYRAGQDSLPEHEREKNTPPEVLNTQKKPLGALIGNGSVGNVKLFQTPWAKGGRKGVSTTLVSVQVTDLKPYEPETGADFDIIDSEESVSSSEDF